MPHVVRHEGEKPQHGRGGEAVSEDIAEPSMPASKIDGQHDRHRQRRRDARQPRGQHAEPTVRAVIGEKPGGVGEPFEK
ncbi:MAG: hypothetical protein QOI87_1391 [Bradyrhizobium sp.]|jgi:hypothetical protein|nr:hypothetical protein [Bradyrhizobium sp.]